ncbi:MAG: DNA-directed DNA polymerase II small subunit [Candidatus Bathyarchaeota archaeon]|jgi:DNA polymerase II small subunit|nr:DNA-directed DNA polymerase II small subunit [Candidatus Bathyarchaeota archaeon A05DMB-5]MDH7557244.1 DNA-directed DNA polymerase II small subunit [Candidatus Bathyarchaeota archaeon]
MSGIEKLQKAVELTISAGYQLNKEAFEFLSTLAATEDPTEIIGKLLKKIETQKEKPLFIEKSFLEEVVKKPESAKEIVIQLPEEKPQELKEPQITEGKKPFHAYAKEVDAQIKVIDDPTGKLSSNGTVEDYLGYFRDRFERIGKLLRQRVDVKSAASVIDALKAPPNAKLKVIGIITEKRESKQKILLTIEDLHANTMVLVPQNAPEELQKKARLLMLDQVVCLSVAKTRSNLLIAEDIILPDIAQKPQRKAPVPVYAVLTSDMHVGSTKFQREVFSRFILWLNGKYGNDAMREMASHVKYVLVAGDIVDGIGVYPNQVKELAVRDVYEQYKLAANYIEQIPDYIEVIIIPGNHDAPRKALPQPAIANTYLKTLEESRNVHSFGNPCFLSLHNVELLLYHGRSLDDITSTIPGMDFNHPEKAMKLLLQSRHLAPTYGGKTPLSPENRDFLVIERVPDIFHAGHVHVLGHTNYRGVLVVNSGGWQEQTSYMRRLGLVPTPGKVPVVNLQTLEVTIIPFN